jgi:hypothetical protein
MLLKGAMRGVQNSEGRGVTSNGGSSLTTQRSIHSAIHERVVAQQGEAIRTTLYNSDHKFLSRLTDEMHTFTA